MKKIISLLVFSSIMMLSTTACDNAKTSVQAPDSPQDEVENSSPETIAENKDDATSDIRQKQLSSDIRSREQRNDAFNDGRAEGRPDQDIASEVRSKLEANLPGSALLVEADDGAVTIAGTVASEENLKDIERLAKEIKGVQAVIVNAKIASATP